MRRAGLYIRVSSAKQDEKTSPATQEAGMREWCAKNDAQVVKVYHEVKSGKYLYERPALTEAWHDWQDGVIDTFVVHDIDRLSREGAHLVMIAQDCHKYGVQLVVAQEPQENTPEAELMLYLRGWAANIERRMIIERSMRAHLDRAKRGALRPGWKPRFGYRWADAAKTRYQVYEPEALVVQKIFSWRHAGIPTRGIQKRLSEEGLLSPTGKPWWSIGTLHELLSYEGYKGTGFTFRSGNAPIALPEGVIPAIVSAEEYDRVQVLMAEAPKMSARNNKRAELFLLRGYVYCVCGKKMWTDGNVKSKDRRYICPDCRKPVHLRTCSLRNGVSATMLDRDVWQEIEHAMSDPGFWQAILPLGLEEEPRPVMDVTRIESRLRELDRSRRKYLDALALSEDGEERAYYRIKLDGLKSELDLLRAERDRILSVRANLEMRGAHLAMLEEYSRDFASKVSRGELTYEEKRATLDLFDVRVTVHPFASRSQRRWELSAVAWMDKISPRAIPASIAIGTTRSTDSYVIFWR